MALATTDFTNGVSWVGGLATNTVGPFTLLGGYYSFTVFDTGSPSASLQIKTPNGNFAPVSLASANSSTLQTLAAGTYKIVLGAGITLCDGALVPIPLRQAP